MYYSKKEFYEALFVSKISGMKICYVPRCPTNFCIRNGWNNEQNSASFDSAPPASSLSIDDHPNELTMTAHLFDGLAP